MVYTTCKWIFKNTTSNRLAIFFPYSIIATRRFRTRIVIPKSSKMQPFYRPAATFLSRRSRKFLYNVRMGGGVLFLVILICELNKCVFSRREGYGPWPPIDPCMSLRQMSNSCRTATPNDKFYIISKFHIKDHQSIFSP